VQKLQAAIYPEYIRGTSKIKLIKNHNINRASKTLKIFCEEMLNFQINRILQLSMSKR
jgi:hypothetical protein